MPTFTLNNVRLVGIAAAVPEQRLEVGDGSVDLTKVIASTGVKGRHVVPASVCTSDLCALAAEKLLAELGWDLETVDLLIFVTQTPDYVLPATACSLHGRIGLPKSCAAFDVNLGCSGYVYGLSMAAAHLSSGAARRALLLVGDTISKVVSAEDRSVAYLFGDAGSATALEAAPDASAMHFLTRTDGSGASYLQIPAGMFRMPSVAATCLKQSREGGNIRSDEQLYMNGPEIFNFTIREVPAMISEVLKVAGWQSEEPDAYIFHQANRYMLDYLVKRMKLPSHLVPLQLERFGNTSSASIPLTICAGLGDRLKEAPARLVLAGFGVGFSWAAVALRVERPAILPVICLPCS
jgi:3-oxoacyl-[acyl-carrier-protein] synthase-3